MLVNLFIPYHLYIRQVLYYLSKKITNHSLLSITLDALTIFKNISSNTNYKMFRGEKKY